MSDKNKVVWSLELFENQISHLDDNNLSLFIDSLEDAIKDVFSNYDIEEEVI